MGGSFVDFEKECGRKNLKELNCEYSRMTEIKPPRLRISIRFFKGTKCQSLVSGVDMPMDLSAGKEWRGGCGI